MKNTNKIDKNKIADWWLDLNNWKLPKGFKKPILYNDEKDFIRGAFAIVSKLISFSEVKEIKKSAQKSRLK